METPQNHPTDSNAEARMEYLFAALLQNIDGDEPLDPTTFLEGLQVSRTEAFSLGCMFMADTLNKAQELINERKP